MDKDNMPPTPDLYWMSEGDRKSVEEKLLAYACTYAEQQTEKFEQARRLYLETLDRAVKAEQQTAKESDENFELRAILAKVTTALGTGAFCSSVCSLEFLKMIPSEVSKTIKAAEQQTAELRAEVELLRWKCDRLDPHDWTHGHEPDSDTGVVK